MDASFFLVIKYTNPTICFKLLELGANMSIADNDGITPIQWIGVKYVQNDEFIVISWRKICRYCINYWLYDDEEKKAFDVIIISIDMECKIYFLILQVATFILCYVDI